MSAERRTLRIAHSKNNCHDLRVMAKTGGSNFFLKDRRLSASFKKETDLPRRQAGLTNLPHKRERQARPPDLFPLLTGCKPWTLIELIFECCLANFLYYHY